MDKLIAYGQSVKALPGGKVAGYGVLFSDETQPDLAGDFFTAGTDFDAETVGYKSAVYYHHGLDPTLKTAKLSIAEFKIDEVGVWFEAQLDLRDEYQAAIYGLAKKGELGWSSGTAPHLVEREAQKNASWIKRWPLGLDISLTPTPCEPKTVVEAKSLAVSNLKAILTAGDKRRALSNAVRSTFSSYTYIEDYSDFEVYVEVYDESANCYKYFAVPYSQSGETFTFGQPYEVTMHTRFEPVSASSYALGRKTFAAQSDETLGALKAYSQRCQDFAALKAESGRPIPPNRLEEIKAIRDELQTVIDRAQKATSASDDIQRTLMEADAALAQSALSR